MMDFRGFANRENFSTAESTQSRWQALSIPVDRIGVLAIEAPPRVIFAHTSSSTTTHNTFPRQR